jgi:hypothetical protein
MEFSRFDLEWWIEPLLPCYSSLQQRLKERRSPILDSIYKWQGRTAVPPHISGWVLNCSPTYTILSTSGFVS